MAQPVPQAMAPGVPFDRAFFEQVLPAAVNSFCSQVKCDRPVVEVLTVDGARLFIQGISGVSESWAALQTTTEEHPHPIQVFVPYQTIFRVEVHACDDKRRPLGFFLNQEPPAAALTVLPPPVEAPAGPAPVAARSRSKPKS